LFLAQAAGFALLILRLEVIMPDVNLAILWHQHQPYYPDDVGGENPMPWVRLHGVKDYYGMALHLLEVAEMHCAINLVPSLIVQLQGYTERGATDRPMQVSRIPADALTEADCLYLLDHFFMANADTMIRPFPRYFELYARRALGKNSAREALKRYKEKDLLDLQVWFNLAWIHPIAVQRDADLRELVAKGRHFTESDKTLILDKHFEILKQILPLHKKLADSGQVELTTTPFFHPILPLLFDKKLAREAMPDVKLPRFTGGYPDDAKLHVQRAVEFHQQVFGTPPRGMWPAEGSVCQPMIPLLAEHGIRWIATDEEILGQATQGAVSRDNHGHVRNPEQLYCSYKVKECAHELSIVFRDHALSDMIGFQYQRSKGEDAANDFIRHLTNIADAVTEKQPPLVTIILDGENCWEHYPDGGVPFLRALYEKCARTKEIHPVKLGSYLAETAPHATLPHLFAGSWINHNFSIWVGHGEDNAGWDALHTTREYLRSRAKEPNLPPEKIRAAWEEIYIAEGSDWFWWYGDDHSSAQDALFDFLFRKHLQNVYLLLGEQPPAEFSRPISRSGQKPMHTMPRSFLDVTVDGRATFFEWLSAGHYTCQNERGTMAMAGPGPIKEVYFGFNSQSLFLRVDFDGRAAAALAEFEALRVCFVEPKDAELRIVNPGRGDQRIELWHQGKALPAENVRVAVDKIFEAQLPFEALNLKVDQPLQFFVEVLENQQSRDRAPREGLIQLTCPSPDFEKIMWDV
jgi:alpha-amylase/alpha-mannosidase (GH57 family)